MAGEAGQAEKALDAAGLSPTEEIVLIESDGLTADDPAFRAVLGDTARALTQTEHVENVRSPLAGEGGSISDDGHSAFVQFEVSGAEEDIDVNLGPSGKAVSALQAANPEFQIDQFGDGSANKAINDTLNADVASAGKLSLPITLVVLVVALGALVAAMVPLVLALTSVMATLAIVAIPSQVFPLGGNTCLLYTSPSPRDRS